MKETDSSMKQRRRKLEHWQVISIYLAIFDVIAAAGSYYIALLLRFDLRYSHIREAYWNAYIRFIPIFVIVTVVVFYLLKLYNSLWRFASFSELNRATAAVAITTAFHVVGITLIHRMPLSYYFIGAVLQYALTVGVRFSYRYITMERSRRRKESHALHNAMIIGAGAAGQVIVKELKSSGDAKSRPVCIIDDNPNKWNRRLDGIPIVGGRDEILAAAEKYHVDQILFAIPTAKAKDKRDILNICKETGCELESLPGIFQLANGDVSLEKMKPVAVEDLLGREPIQVNNEEILAHLQGQRILVTGGGGSIGSELCRQIAAHDPELLIIFDIYENNAYDIEQELKRRYPDLHLVTLIGSVRDSRRIHQVFEKYRPDIVFHAAAHKHVPLMETSPSESIKNNVVGTYKTAYAAMLYGTKRFVLISTDKAVNPTSIMGASKRICEMVIQTMDAISKAGRMDLLPFLHAHMDQVTDGDGQWAAKSIHQAASQGTADSMKQETVQAAADHQMECKATQAAGNLMESGAADSTEQAAADSMDRSVVNPGPEAVISTAGNGTAGNGTAGKKQASGLQIGSVKNKERTGTQFVAVRFGNVLGSNGSVIPLFKKQIEEGGPVTVTHPDIIRYFMTIPEAVSLVLQASAYAWGGEIFVLDMGEPMKIDTLARNLIRLSGYKPDEDIKIVYTGLRPGEKLYEEKLMAEEGMKKTDNEMIHIGKPIQFDIDQFLLKLQELAKTSYENDDEKLLKLVEEIVPTYHSPQNH